jgi:hypothetical protein
MNRRPALFLSISAGLITIGLSAIIPDVGRDRIDPRFAPIDAWRDDDGSWVFVEPEPDDPVDGLAGRFDPRGEIRLVYINGNFPDLRWYGVDGYRSITMNLEYYIFSEDGSLNRRDAEEMEPRLLEAFTEYLADNIVSPSLERNDEVWTENGVRRTRVNWERRWIEVRVSSLAWTFMPGLVLGLGLYALLRTRSMLIEPGTT